MGTAKKTGGTPHIEAKVYRYDHLDNIASAEPAARSAILEFSGIGDNAVYNPCPFVREGKLHILGRVEPAASEISHVDLFQKDPNLFTWSPAEFRLENTQDPFVTCINGRMVVGGVELSLRKLFSGLFQISTYRTSFWDFETKQKIAEGPKEMKDIRLVDLNKKIGIFTRPRSEKKGKVVSSINFGITDTLAHINDEYISTLSSDPAAEVKGFFGDNEWGGVNSVYTLEDDWLGVVGHIAYYGDEVDGSGLKARKYAAMAFEFNPTTGDITHPIIILARRHVPFEMEAKRDDLHDVIFPGGIIFLSHSTESPSAGVLDDKILFFYGVGDAYVGVSELAYPFSRKLDMEHGGNGLFVLPESEVEKYIRFS